MSDPQPAFAEPESPPGRPDLAELEGATPVMAQFLRLKAEHPDFLLFFRMGDFFELFFEDAVIAAAALDIALTKRGKHLGADIPMCGVPVERADAYLERLIRKGHRVAIAEQVEDPAEARKRGAKAVVERRIIRLVTAGTLTEDALLEARAPNYLASLAGDAKELAFAWLDLSTGELGVERLTPSEAMAALARVEPAEILVTEDLARLPALTPLGAELARRVTTRPPSSFARGPAERRLKALFGVAALEGFGAFSGQEIAALGALADYVELTQKGALPSLRPPKASASGETLLIDAATRANLELTRTLAGGREGSLLDTIDRTVTSAGGRLLARRLQAPLTDGPAIASRHDAIAYFLAHRDLADELREGARRLPDLERALQRLTLGRGSPRDLAAIRDSLLIAAALRYRLARALAEAEPPAIIATLEREGLAATSLPLGAHLKHALAPEPPLALGTGGVIAPGYAPPLDELRSLAAESRRHIANLEAKYVELTGARTLRIKHNGMLGYFVEMAAKDGERFVRADSDHPFIHRQTMANAVRFTTAELSELAARIADAGNEALAREAEIFASLLAEVREAAPRLQLLAEALAELDVTIALAELACEQDYIRPRMSSEAVFRIEGGRHPVVEAHLKRRAEPFTGNDCRLGSAEDGRLWLVTGPNMAGKSTYLRQNALLVLLAQMGSYVPARSAEIGLVDRLFSRVGAADDIARGRSTFMVEMVETAAILNQATARSFVILDEIGRGTATFDGLAIAWACVEHLHDVIGCRTLFATHYHELTGLAERLEGVQAVTMAVKEWRGNLVFLHEVVPGAADRSYGLQVARLAGLPREVLGRAGAILKELEASGGPTAMRRLVEELPLFAFAARREDSPAPVEEAAVHPVLLALQEMNPDRLTPREALELLYRLKGLAEG